MLRGLCRLWILAWIETLAAASLASSLGLFRRGGGGGGGVPTAAVYALVRLRRPLRSRSSREKPKAVISSPQRKKLMQIRAAEKAMVWMVMPRPQTCVVLLLDRCDGPTAMLTLDEDCVSVVFPPSAADRPEITRPLEKLRLPNSRLRVEEEEDTWAEETHVLSLTTKREEPWEEVGVCAHLAGALLVLGRLELRADPTGPRQPGNLIRGVGSWLLTYRSRWSTLDV